MALFALRLLVLLSSHVHHHQSTGRGIKFAMVGTTIIGQMRMIQVSPSVDNHEHCLQQFLRQDEQEAPARNWGVCLFQRNSLQRYHRQQYQRRQPKRDQSGILSECQRCHIGHHMLDGA